MTNNQPRVLMFIVFLYTSCLYRINCDGVKDKYLDKIEFSTDIKNSYTERYKHKIIFGNAEEEYCLLIHKPEQLQRIFILGI